jgi:hypothetical protein
LNLTYGILQNLLQNFFPDSAQNLRCAIPAAALASRFAPMTLGREPSAMSVSPVGPVADDPAALPDDALFRRLGLRRLLVRAFDKADDVSRVLDTGLLKYGYGNDSGPNSPLL